MRRMLLMVGVLLAVPAAYAESADSDWQFALTPYLWLPTISLEIDYDDSNVGGGGPSVETGPIDWLESLDMALLVAGSAQKGRWSFTGDFIYLALSNDLDSKITGVENPIDGERLPIDVGLNLDVETELDGYVATATAGYQFVQEEDRFFETFAGVRLFSLESTVEWQLTADITAPGGQIQLPANGSADLDEDIFDGIVGFRGSMSLGSGKWSLLYHGDVGAGDSDLVWNAFAGVSRQFGWGDLVLVYRHLDYDHDRVQEFSFGGLLVGARFHL